MDWRSSQLPHRKGRALFARSSISGYAFTGREWDAETGLYSYRARYYDPAIGRFLSRDSLGPIDGPNLYSYVRGNPVGKVDPFGLCAAAPDSVRASLLKAIATGNVPQIKMILEVAKDVLEDDPALRQRAADAVTRLESTDQDVIAKELKGSVLREFPSEYLDKRLEKIYRDAAKGNEAAQTAKKFLTDLRFRK